MIITNAFSLNMLDCDVEHVITLQPLTVEEVRKFAAQFGLESAVGHADTAQLFSDLLGLDIPANRMNVTMTEGPGIIVGQHKGPRLPEGSTTLPEGASIKWVLVEFM